MFLTDPHLIHRTIVVNWCKYKNWIAVNQGLHLKRNMFVHSKLFHCFYFHLTSADGVVMGSTKFLITTPKCGALGSLYYRNNMQRMF